MIQNDGLNIPSEKEIFELIEEYKTSNLETVAASIDLLDIIRRFNLDPGWLKISFPYKK